MSLPSEVDPHGNRIPGGTLAELRSKYDLGENDLGAPMIQQDGGCYDGLSPTGPNLNRGAESLLSFQLATVRIAALSPSESVTSIAAGG